LSDQGTGLTESILRRSVRELSAVQDLVVSEHLSDLVRIVQAVTRCLRAGGKLLLFGNGGSAADAQHVAAELVSRFLLDRDPLPAIALSTNSSILTSVSNDYCFEDVFARQVRALASPGDVVVGISTSGHSPNVVRGLQAAREKGAVTIGFCGRTGGELKDWADICFCVPSDHTPRVQEVQVLAWHVICEAVEAELFGQ
jgi:D-sedoheptulose 7-phosphate isomerase